MYLYTIKRGVVDKIKYIYKNYYIININITNSNNTIGLLEPLLGSTEEKN